MNFTKTSPLDVLAMEMKLRSPFLKAIESILFGVIMLIAVFGNLLTLIAVYRNKNLRTIPNLFVISLAISDLGIGLTCMTLSCSALITSTWLYGNVICQFEGYLVITFAAASILTLAAMGFNRYIGIVKCLLYRSYFTTRRTNYLISVIWIVSAFPPFLYLATGERFIFHPGKLFCFSDTNASWFTAFLVVVYVGLPSFLILFTYSKVFQTIHARNKRFQTISSRNKQKKDEVGDTVSVEEIRVTRTLFVIVLFYMVCWTPVLIIDLVDACFGRLVSPRRLYLAYTFLASISSTSNPVIYGVMNRSFRKEYTSILKFLPCLKNKRFSDQEGLGNSYNRATVVLSEGDITQKSPFVILHGKSKYEEPGGDRRNNDSLDNVDNGKDKKERIIMTKL